MLGAESGRPIDLSQRKSGFDQYIAPPDDNGCWLWTGFRTTNGPTGYGRLQLTKRRAVLAHRAVYTALVGPIPEGMTLDHTCRVRLCVNPAHLEVVTNAENSARRRGLHLRTHCQRGHAFTPENTYVDPSGPRVCVECRRARGRVYDAKRRAAA